MQAAVQHSPAPLFPAWQAPRSQVHRNNANSPERPCTSTPPLRHALHTWYSITSSITTSSMEPAPAPAPAALLDSCCPGPPCVPAPPPPPATALPDSSSSSSRNAPSSSAAIQAQGNARSRGLDCSCYVCVWGGCTRAAMQLSRLTAWPAYVSVHRSWPFQLRSPCAPQPSPCAPGPAPCLAMRWWVLSSSAPISSSSLAPGDKGEAGPGTAGAAAPAPPPAPALEVPSPTTPWLEVEAVGSSLSPGPPWLWGPAPPWLGPGVRGPLDRRMGNDTRPPAPLLPPPAPPPVTATGQSALCAACAAAAAAAAVAAAAASASAAARTCTATQYRTGSANLHGQPTKWYIVFHSAPAV